MLRKRVHQIFAVLCARVDNMDYLERDKLCFGSLDLYHDVSIAQTPDCKIEWLVSYYLEGIWKEAVLPLFQYFPESGPVWNFSPGYPRYHDIRCNCGGVGKSCRCVIEIANSFFISPLGLYHFVSSSLWLMVLNAISSRRIRGYSVGWRHDIN
jgi:hypothetical protein